MLTRLDVRDFAIVGALELELGAGMTVLTGETGAGKSILIEALGLALGDRADTGAIRAGAERAEVTATFDVRGGPSAVAWLDEHGIAAGDECLAIFRGAELAAYGWYSTRPTPAVAPELVLHFAPGYVYQYKGFTLPAHRGYRLHAIGKTRALRHYLEKHYRGLLSYV